MNEVRVNPDPRSESKSEVPETDARTSAGAGRSRWRCRSFSGAHCSFGALIGLPEWERNRCWLPTSRTTPAPEKRRECSINGTFFLTQVVRGRYDHVEVAMDSISDGPLRLESLTADLYGVHLPFHDILVGQSNSVLIDRTHEAALLRWEDLNSYLEFTGRTVRIEPTDDGQVLLTATTNVLGTTVSASAEAELSAEEGGIAIQPRRLQTQSPIDSASELLLGRRFTFIVPLDPLPFGQNVTEITVLDDGLLVQAGGVNVVVVP